MMTERGLLMATRSLAVATLVIGLLPFITLSFYAVPNLEDYAESIIPKVWWHVKYLYLTYDGRYFTSFLFAAANPLKHGSLLGYQLIPITLFILLLTALLMLFRTFLPRLGKRTAFSLGTVAMVTYIDLNPNIPYSFYYMISSYIYMLPCIMLIMLVAVCRKLLLEPGFTRVFFLLAAAMFLIVAITGSNELLLIPLVILIMILTLINQGSGLNKGGEIAVLALTFSCAIFVVLTSPGIHAHVSGEEADMFSSSYIIDALMKSVGFSVHHIRIWLTESMTIYMASILFVSVVLRDDRTVKGHWAEPFNLRRVLVAALLTLSGTLLVAFPYCWAAGGKATSGYSQIFAVTELFFLAGWFSLLYILAERFGKQVPERVTTGRMFTVLPFVLFAITLLAFGNGKVRAAYNDLITGEAARYHGEVSEHIRMSRNSSRYADEAGVLRICELSSRPSTIFSGIYFKQGDEAFHLQYRHYYGIDHLEVEACENQ
jgi:hypothetical protein